MNKPEYEDKTSDLELLSGYLDSAVKDVLETMTGFELLPLKLSEEEHKSHLAELTGMIILRGRQDAVLCVSADRNTAMIIIAYMTGIMPEELEDEDLFDGISELVNLIAGRTKSQLTGHKLHFQISPPITIAGDNHFIIHKNHVSKIALKYAGEDIEILIKLFYIT